MVRPAIRRAALAAALAALVLSVSFQAQSVPEFSTGEMKEWLTYLASDELQGRQVYTEGLGLAAAYIADHLEAWGVRPAGDEGGYFQTVKVLGMRTRSNSSITIVVNGQTKTFKDGEGVTFPRNQGAKQTIAGSAGFVGYGMAFAPLNMDDYAGRDVRGSVAIYLGRGEEGLTSAHDRLVNARGRVAIDTHGAIAAIGPATTAAPNAATTAAANPQRVDFQTAQRLDRTIAPQITAGDDLLEFLFSASGHRYADLKARADRREPLPPISLAGATITIDVDAEYDLVQTRLSRNVVGLVDGTDAALKDTYVMLGAHYDHVGYQQFAPTAPPANTPIASCPGQERPVPRAGDIINNGADDDGSGTVALMALAKTFATGPKPRRSVLFVWHTGEEGGLFGSRYMADYPTVPLESVAAQLNMDMIGRNHCDDPAAGDSVFVVGSDRISTELHNINEEANASLPAPLTLDYALNDTSDLEVLYTRSDHYSYASKGVPVIFFHTGLHRDYHYVTDEVDKIVFPKLARITQLVYATAWRVANLGHLPARDNRGPRVGAGQRGTIPLN